MRRTRGLWVSMLFVGLLTGLAVVGLVGGGLRPQLGLDLEGGVSAILSAPEGTPPDVMERALENIRRRVDAFGVGEPDIFLSGTTIEVQIPGAAKSTVVRRPVDLRCLVGDPSTNFGCTADEAVAADALDGLEIGSRPTEVCLVTGDGDELSCHSSRAEAEFARLGIAIVAKDGTASPSASPSASASPSSGPAPAAEQYCLTGETGAELACFPERPQAERAQRSIELRITKREFCVEARAPASPSPSPSPSASASATPSTTTEPPSAFSRLEDANDELPCLASENDAQAALARIAAMPVTERSCVVSSGGGELGCFLTRDRAARLQRETGSRRLLDQIGKTARLEVRKTLALISPGDPAYLSTAITCGTPEEQATPACGADALAGRDITYLDGDGDPNTLDTKVVMGEVVITGADIDRALAVLQGDTVPEWTVQFELSGEGTKAFADATTAALSQPPPRNRIAIVVDRDIISNPSVDEAITAGRGFIRGGFSEDSARELATQLSAGSLPVELTRQSVRTISPTLGSESLRQGVFAGIAGLVLLLLYLLFYYRLLGIVAWLGMSIWAGLALALISLAGDRFGYALSLAGVAGLVISLGITADSYIVFFERLKDEVRNGRSARSAVQPAFKRAFRTIVAADIVTGIAAAVLYVTAVSSVRGFALTLGVATLLDLFVVYFFKRPTVFLIARSPGLIRMRGLGLESGVAADHVPIEDGS